MDYKIHRKAFLKNLPLGRMNGQQKFLSLAAWLSKGQKSKNVSISDLRENWYKTELGIQYNSSFYSRAQEENWVEPTKKNGCFNIKDEGFSHLEALAINTKPGDPMNKAGKLIIFREKSSHSFDKFLRGIFAGAQKNVMIADSYVDETIFDNLLDIIPKTVDVRLLYKKKQGTFDTRVRRFKIEYPKFQTKKNDKLHDRFIIIDNYAYLTGPSLKDAASKSPANLVILGISDAKKLKELFNTMWR